MNLELLNFELFLASWRPLLDPMALHQPWSAPLLMPPLVIAIALVYKALKLPTLQGLGLETARLSLYLIALMTTAAALLWAVIEIA